MTKEKLDKANHISHHISDLESLLRDFTRGARIRVEDEAYSHPLATKHIQKDVTSILISGIRKRIKELKEEFKNL